MTWHEVSGSGSIDIEVTDGGTTTVTVVLDSGTRLTCVNPHESFVAACRNQMDNLGKTGHTCSVWKEDDNFTKIRSKQVHTPS